MKPLEARGEMPQRRRLPEHLEPDDPRAPAIEILEDLADERPPGVKFDGEAAGRLHEGMVLTRKPLAQSDSPALYERTSFAS